MADEKRAAGQKVFDVAKPGKTAATPASKEVLVANRPMMQDPMMAKPDGSANFTGEMASGATDAALHGQENGAVSRAETTVAPPESDGETTDTKQSEVEETKPTISKFSDSDDKSDAADATAEEESTGTDHVDESKKAEVEAREATEHDKKMQELVESHKYYLPINQIEKRRNTRSAIIGTVIVLLLALVWVDVALDAGLITIPGVKAPTHFFQ